MSFDTSESWQRQFDYLRGLLEAHTGPGDFLDGVAAVEEVSPPEGRDLPAIGIQFKQGRNDFESQGFEAQTNFFEISLVIARDFDPLQSDIVREAKVQVENLWNNRRGGGLGPLLRSDGMLGGTAQWSIIKDIQVVVLRDVTEKTRISAVVACTLVAKGRLEIF